MVLNWTVARFLYSMKTIYLDDLVLQNIYRELTPLEEDKREEEK